MASSSPADHPRIRGEHVRHSKRVSLSFGSSPHTRGARVTEIQPLGGARIIPAYAGSTWIDKNQRIADKDHPRIRGEHAWRGVLRGGVSGIIPAYAGSTPPLPDPAPDTVDHPRIRGEHWYRSGSPRAVGWIIPAYAGSTMCRRRRRWRGWDHPRIRGEHF